MLFVEPRFLFFFLVVFSVYWTLRTNRARKIWLLVASYVFYAGWDWRFTFILMASTTMDFFVGLRIEDSDDPRIRRRWLLVSLCVNLGVLCFFKYFNFFLLSGAQFLGWLGVPASVSTLKILLPVGVSFYTFQSMSYSIDIYRRRLTAVRQPLDLAFFISFFPQLVAGPIVRALTFLPQLTEKRRFRDVDVRGALMLFLVGFFKKACVSETVAPLVDQYFAAPSEHTALAAWIGTACYAVQIYCDFSGYTDMAIACARLLGYELTINFNFPYFSSSITEFWRRWHISLSTWLRDYLYISLGGNRGSTIFTYRNLMLTMVLGGLWHGASWNFVIWGGLHGLGLIVHKEWKNMTEKVAAIPAVMRWLGVPLTFYWVCLTWVFFRANGLAAAGTVLKSFVLLQSPGVRTFAPSALGFLAVLAGVHGIASRGILASWWRRGPDWIFALGYGGAAAALLTVVPAKYTPFIYFQF